MADWMLLFGWIFGWIILLCINGNLLRISRELKRMNDNKEAVRIRQELKRMNDNKEAGGGA
jgi:hypothetical protein